MKESLKVKSKNVTFHLWVVWDPLQYLSPHLAIKSLERIDKKKGGKVVKTELSVPEPRRRKYQSLYKFSKYLVQYSQITFMIGTTLLILLSAIYCFFDPKESFVEEQQHEQQQQQQNEESKGKRNKKSKQS